MEKVWRRCGEGVEKVLIRCGEDVEEVYEVWRVRIRCEYSDVKGRLCKGETKKGGCVLHKKNALRIQWQAACVGGAATIYLIPTS